MTALSEQATLVALDVEEIAEYDRAISELEYQICDCSLDNPAALENEKKRLQEKANRLVNNLKDEGIELVYDGRFTQVTRHGQLWLELDRDGENTH